MPYINIPCTRSRTMKFGCPPTLTQLTLIGLVLSVMSVISSTSSIILFSTKLNNLANYDYINAYVEDVCFIDRFYAYPFNCSGQKEWILLFEDSLKRVAVENPFARKNTKAAVILESQRFVLKKNYTCMCRPNTEEINSGCQIWPVCVLDEDFIEYMQADNSRDHSNFISFIAVSCVSVVLTSIMIPISCKSIQYKLEEESYTTL